MFVCVCFDICARSLCPLDDYRGTRYLIDKLSENLAADMIDELVAENDTRAFTVSASDLKKVILAKPDHVAIPNLRVSRPTMPISAQSNVDQRILSAK